MSINTIPFFLLSIFLSEKTSKLKKNSSEHRNLSSEEREIKNYFNISVVRYFFIHRVALQKEAGRLIAPEIIKVVII